MKKGVIGALLMLFCFAAVNSVYAVAVNFASDPPKKIYIFDVPEHASHFVDLVQNSPGLETGDVDFRVSGFKLKEPDGLASVNIQARVRVYSNSGDLIFLGPWVSNRTGYLFDPQTGELNYCGWGEEGSPDNEDPCFREVDDIDGIGLGIAEYDGQKYLVQGILFNALSDSEIEGKFIHSYGTVAVIDMDTGDIIQKFRFKPSNNSMISGEESLILDYNGDGDDDLVIMKIKYIFGGKVSVTVKVYDLLTRDLISSFNYKKVDND